jgi:hypothetical protein
VRQEKRDEVKLVSERNAFLISLSEQFFVTSDPLTHTLGAPTHAAMQFIKYFLRHYQLCSFRMSFESERARAAHGHTQSARLTCYRPTGDKMLRSTIVKVDPTWHGKTLHDLTFDINRAFTNPTLMRKCEALKMRGPNHEENQSGKVSVSHRRTFYSSAKFSPLVDIENLSAKFISAS